MEDLLKIEIGETKYTCKFGMYAIKLICDKRKISLTEFWELFVNLNEELAAYDVMVDLLYAGVKNYQLINGLDEDINYHQLYNDFGQVDDAKGLLILNAFGATTYKGKKLVESSEQLDQQPDSKKK
jgi:hypothetical protein